MKLLLSIFLFLATGRLCFGTEQVYGASTPCSFKAQPKFVAAHAEGTWKLKITNFLFTSGDFTFRVEIDTFDGKVYKSKVFHSTSLPATPITFKLKNPARGPCFLYVHVLSITTQGGLVFSGVFSNNKNSRKFFTVSNAIGESLALGKRFLASAFSIP